MGYGPYESEIKRLIAVKSLENNVALAGFYPNPRAFYEATDIYVSSSLSEALPLTLIEALSMGKPIVSTNCDFGPREILEDGKYGKLVPLNDPTALCQAIKETILYPLPSEPLITRARFFSSDASIQRYLELINV